MPRNRNKTYAENRISRIRHYGIDVKDYERMLFEQDGVCAICKEPPSKRALDIDHNHKTGKVRGLLCSNHNRALGLFSDDIVLLLRATEYLVKSNG